MEVPILFLWAQFFFPTDLLFLVFLISLLFFLSKNLACFFLCLFAFFFRDSSVWADVKILVFWGWFSERRKLTKN